LAGDEEAWLSLVALSNRAYLGNADFRGPRVDWRDLEEHSAGELICLTGGPLVGVLTPLIEQAADPSNPVEAVALASRLSELYPHVSSSWRTTVSHARNWSIAGWLHLHSDSTCLWLPRIRCASRVPVMRLHTRSCRRWQKGAAQIPLYGARSRTATTCRS
jgi:hypothetical protein